MQRAEGAGCKAIALTVDAQVWGRRERDIKNRFWLPKGLSIKNLMPTGKEQFPKEQADFGLAAYVTWQFDQTLCWKDVEWLCAKAKVPVLSKVCCIRKMLVWQSIEDIKEALVGYKPKGLLLFSKIRGLKVVFF